MEQSPPDNFVTDQELDLFFAAKEAGKSFPDALRSIRNAQFSAVETHALKEFWEIHTNLTKTVHNISPAPKVFQSILEQVPVGVAIVTEAHGGGYIKKDTGPSVSIISAKLNQLMQMNWKIAAPIAIVVIAVVSVMKMGGGEVAPLAMNTREAPVAADAGVMTNAAQPEGQAMMAMKTAPASGNVDDLVVSLNDGADAELALAPSGADDIALFTTDSQSINDLTTAYDETTF